MALETVIGLEVHAQLKTNTKIFCSKEMSHLMNCNYDSKNYQCNYYSH